MQKEKKLNPATRGNRCGRFPESPSDVLTHKPRPPEQDGLVPLDLAHSKSSISVCPVETVLFKLCYLKSLVTCFQMSDADLGPQMYCETRPYL